MSAKQTPFPVRPVLISLTIHGLILFIFFPDIPNIPLEAMSGRLAVRLVAAKSASPDTGKGTTVSVATLPPEAAGKRPSAPGRAVVARSVVEAPVRVRAGPMPAPAKADAGGQASTPESPGVPGEPEVGQSPSAMAIGDDLRAYRIALAIEARRFWRRDAADQETATRARVGIAVVVPPLGMPEVHVARSSGDERLDGRALALIAQTVRQVSMPESLRRRGLRIEVPVEFGPAD